MSINKQIIKDFLNKCSIVFDDFSQLDGMLIPRELLLSNEKYESVKDDIEKMKKLYSSGSLTALQKNAEASQKWPLLNLVRQILKSNNFNMDPIRKSNGYTKGGKKKYLRFFIIKKIKSTKELEEVSVI
uniref:Uncharacterized protein n=1 Tax=viral metagenome TaxID=1070528 RepID=A0A6C0J933_9ZZZZ|tara:strand:- start:980 stop:1366 length:387 start_codon:yes stop_codon:yes gene_type:complete